MLYDIIYPFSTVANKRTKPNIFLLFRNLNYTQIYRIDLINIFSKNDIYFRFIT